MFTYTNILSAILYFLNGGSNDIIHILKISLMSALKKKQLDSYLLIQSVAIHCFSCIIY